MNPRIKHSDTVRSIQARLLILLVRAFAVVVTLTLLFVFTSVSFILAYPTRYSPLDSLPIVARLQTYYQLSDSWDEVEQLFNSDVNDNHLWANSVLLDDAGLVRAYKGSTTAPEVGQPYVPEGNIIRFALKVKGQKVGELIFISGFIPAQWRIVLGLLTPVALVSLFLAILTVIIAALLMRRVVIPLSEVVAASRAVAAGDLSTRVAVSGPDDLRTLSDSFNHMADALERNDRERRNMLADIAHELRTPLTVIRGRLEGIVDGIYPADEGHVVPALEETYLLERLVEDLRLLTLAETRQLPFERREVDLNALAARVMDLFRGEADEKGIGLALEADPLPVQAHLDPQRTEQVVSNLVGNALRYTPEGGNIWITVKRDQGRPILSVSDNGPGVPAEDIPHMFDRFWRGEKSRSRASGGAGLGLAIARQLVEAQDGKISARNRESGGLEMKIEF